jgi:very-short-patch-repair endonuclease
VLPDFIADAFRTAPGGVLTMRQLRRLGVADRWVLALAEEGDVERLMHGCYADPAQDVPADRPLHLAVAYLSQRRPAHRRPEVISGTAAIAHRCQPDLGYPARVLVLSEQERRPRKPRTAFRVVRTDLGAIDSEIVRRVAVAPVDRALEDAAGIERVSDERLRQAVYALKHRRLIDVVAAARTWHDRDTAGARRLVRLAETGEFDHESPAERSVFQQLFTDFPPAPDCQVYLTPSIRVDAVFLSAALVLEYHGEDWHNGSVDADSTRAWALIALGYMVIAVTRSMRRDPAALAAQIHGIRREREHLIATGALRLPPLPPQPPRLTPLRTLHVA